MGKLSLIFVSFAFFATSASAGNSCLETFSENPAKQHPAIQDLKSAQKWLGQAERVSHINEGLHGLVVSANRILDAAIENIVMINFSNLSASQKTKRGKLTEVLIEELQHSFGISDELMKMVISQRVSREVEYHQSVQAKQQSRQAIGFAREESSVEFHSESGGRYRVGFKAHKQKDETSDAESVTIGFQSASKEVLDGSIKELVEYAEAHYDSGPVSAGFRPSKNEGHDTEAVEIAVGFKLFPETRRPIKQKYLSEVIFDIDSGEFRIQRKSN